MTSLLLVALVVAAVAAGKGIRLLLNRGLGNRSRAVLLVAAIIGLQTVVGAPAALAESCGEAPNPERPGTGMVGALDAAKGRGEKDSPYKEYGYAGMVWHTYQTDCGPLAGVMDASVTLDTWAGNQLFNVGKNIVGATNSLHYTVMDGGLFSPLYDAIKKGADAVYNNIYAQLLGLVMLVLALFLFRHIWRGDLATVSKKALYAVGALWLAASSFALLQYFDEIDRAVVQTTTAIQAGFVNDSDGVVAHHVLPTALHNEVVYKNWLRGEFGKPDTPEAREHARALLDAQAFTWAQTERREDADEGVIQAKKDEYERIANDLGTSQGYFTGEDGSRTGSGFIAFLQSVIYALFQLLAKAAVLLAQILIRVLALTAPLLGLVALLHHDVLRRVGKVAGTVAFNLIVIAALAGIHALLLNALFSASGQLSMLAQMAIATLVTILLFVVGKPVRRLWQMVDVSTRAVGAALPAAPGLFSRFRRQPHGTTAQDRFWQDVRDTDIDAPSPGAIGTSDAAGRRLRPEASSPVHAKARRLDGAEAVAGAPDRAALPVAGAPNPAGLAFGPARLSGDGIRLEQRGIAAPPQSDSAARTVQAQRYMPPVLPTSYRSHDGGDGFVVPSRLSPPEIEYGPNGQEPRPVPRPEPVLAAPRRVEAEVIDGRPVYVLYRPSRGLEVRGPSAAGTGTGYRDTDAVVR